MVNHEWWNCASEDVALQLEEINLDVYRQILKENGANKEYLEGMSMFTITLLLR